jgi:thiol-disulfide isomerase/thioredoxin
MDEEPADESTHPALGASRLGARFYVLLGILCTMLALMVYGSAQYAYRRWETSKLQASNLRHDQELEQWLAPTRVVGDIAPPVRLSTWLREPVPALTLASGPSRPSGNTQAQTTSGPLILDFWHTRCAPCVAGLPRLSALQEKYKSTGLRVVGITGVGHAPAEEELPYTRDEITAFVNKRTDLRLSFALDTDFECARAFSAFRVSGSPQTFMINREGRVVWADHGVPKSDEEIERLLQL